MVESVTGPHSLIESFLIITKAAQQTRAADSGAMRLHGRAIRAGVVALSEVAGKHRESEGLTLNVGHIFIGRDFEF
jgi:hypothetical protein